MKWFKRKNDELNALRVEFKNELQESLRSSILEGFRSASFKAEVKHTIDKKIPHPVTAFIAWYDDEGKRYQSMPFNLAYRNSIPIEVPVSFLTGRKEDINLRPHVELMLQYDPQDYR